MSSINDASVSEVVVKGKGQRQKLFDTKLYRRKTTDKHGLACQGAASGGRRRRKAASGQAQVRSTVTGHTYTNMANGEFFSFSTFSYGPFRTVVLRKYLNSNSSSTSAKSPAHMAKIHNMYLRLNHKHWKKVGENTKVAIDNGLK